MTPTLRPPLTLAARYLKVSQNWAWWDKNKSRLKDIAYRNIALSTKPSGLTSVYFEPARSQVNNAGYRMDQPRGLPRLRATSARF
jgi:hypothetical protein